MSPPIASFPCMLVVIVADWTALYKHALMKCPARQLADHCRALGSIKNIKKEVDNMSHQERM